MKPLLARPLAALAAAAVLLGSGAALAQMGGGKGDGPRGDRMRDGGAMRAERVEAMFERFDANGDGAVDADEVAAYRAARFAEADADGDEKLTFEEWDAFRAAEAARRGFERRDLDGDGALDPDEWDSMPVRFIDRFDADGDGKVTREEAENARAWRWRR
jgi:Ca2+-binding EF-hand superfamily protein